MGQVLVLVPSRTEFPLPVALTMIVNDSRIRETKPEDSNNAACPPVDNI